ncbi:hypothetical protein [Thauera sp.]|uniref:hypothetical protein n=1 Tax=Thauera sp. TaxID=1905334 RepID=UPI0039E270F7
MSRSKLLLFRIGVLASVGCFLPISVQAASPSVQVTPVLQADAAVVAVLAALGPGEAALLGRARLIGDFNDVARRFDLHRTGPRGRDYSIKMVWAEDRGRALFAGANHGQPHRLNDVWEFDLGALSWVLRYPPDNPRSYAGLGDDPSDVEYRNGVLATRRGGPAVVGHTWWGLAYHPRTRRLLWMNLWGSNLDKLVVQRGGEPDSRYKGLPLWSFDPETAHWELLRTTGAAPRAAFAGMLEYIDSLGDVVWHANNWQMRGTWRFDIQNLRWYDLGAKGQGGGSFAAESPAPEQVGYYDPRRDILVVQRGRATYHFDVRTRTWSKVREEDKDGQAVPDGHDAWTTFVHHPRSGHGLLVDFRQNAIWSYRPDTHEWRKLEPNGSSMPAGRKRLAYLDPLHDVLVVIDGIDVWAYRYSGTGS